MLLRKYMSRIGIGAATVDLVLEKDAYYPGETVKGNFFIKGGTIKQSIKKLQCDLIKMTKMGQQKVYEIIATTTILTHEIIDSDDRAKIPFEFVLPENLMPSTDSLTYRFKSTLVFSKGVDSLDHDHIQILTKS